VASVSWTSPALQDLEGIWSFIARDSEQAADSIRERLLDASEQLEAFPLSGRILPEAESEFIREIIIGSYRLIYHIVSIDEVEVLGVLHGARRLDL
jgi:toxin ParE1/3/4